MASNRKQTRLKLKRKKTKAGKTRKRKLRAKGSTPSLDDVLGPLEKKKK